MIVTIADLTARVEAVLAHRGHPELQEIAWACGWLEACGYPGVKLLLEAMDDERTELPLARDVLGIDLQNVSCVWLAPAIISDVKENGRAFLRNVRHGLYLVPFTVRDWLGIGCPIDPAFPLGGERSKNPYEEKLAAAAEHGLVIDQGMWDRLAPSA